MAHCCAHKRCNAEIKSHFTKKDFGDPLKLQVNLDKTCSAVGSFKADCSEFKKFLKGAWNITLVQELRPSTRPVPSMFQRLISAPSRARQKVSTAEPWKAASPNWDPNIPARSPGLTTWPISCTNRASWRRRG